MCTSFYIYPKKEQEKEKEKGQKSLNSMIIKTIKRSGHWYLNSGYSDIDIEYFMLPKPHKIILKNILNQVGMLCFCLYSKMHKLFL